MHSAFVSHAPCACTDAVTRFSQLLDVDEDWSPLARYFPPFCRSICVSVWSLIFRFVQICRTTSSEKASVHILPLTRHLWARTMAAVDTLHADRISITSLDRFILHRYPLTIRKVTFENEPYPEKIEREHDIGEKLVECGRIPVCNTPGQPSQDTFNRYGESPFPSGTTGAGKANATAQHQMADSKPVTGNFVTERRRVHSRLGVRKELLDHIVGTGQAILGLVWLA